MTTLTLNSRYLSYLLIALFPLLIVGRHTDGCVATRLRSWASRLFRAAAALRSSTLAAAALLSGSKGTKSFLYFSIQLWRQLSKMVPLVD